MKKRLLGLLVFFTITLLKVEAQEFTPFMSSPYAGVTAGQMNPASLAGSKYRFDATLLGVSAGLHNNLLRFDRSEVIFNFGMLTDMWGYRNDFLDLTIPENARTTVKDVLKNSTSKWDEDKYGGYFGSRIDILNLMYSWDRFSLAGGFGMRWMGGAAEVPKEIAAEGLGNRINGTVPPYANANFDYATTAYVALFNQAFITAAYSIVDNGTSRLKLGLTAKLLFNGKSAFGFAENYAGHFSGITGLKPIDVRGAEFGEAGVANKSKLGYAGDIGIEYEYRPESLAGNQVDYRYKFGVALIDLGQYESEATNGNNIRHEKLKQGTGVPHSFHDLFTLYGTGTDEKAYKMSLPTKVTASFDYHIGSGPIFLNASAIIAMHSKQMSKAYSYNAYTFTPHAEWKNFGAAVPLQYDGYNKFSAGLALRAWRHIWVGSNTVITNVINKESYGADVHAMLKVPILKKDDKDGDGVADKDDKCPDTPGLKKFQGCPDTDGDGIPDPDDACPNEAGPVETNGCPDRDGDGIADKDDRCPDQAGTKEMQGCPDKDNDGVADIDDECPDQAGPASTKGCPDKDGDGVADKDDRCPDQPGTAALQGCPDRDGDGVADIDDECPDQAGPKENKGCPYAVGVQNVEFDIDQYNVKPQYYAELDKAIEDLKQNPNKSIKVVGHTDITYTHAYNMALSKRRAEAVKSYMVKKGIDAKRIATEYYGPDRPIADNNTEAGRAKNRRSEMTIVVK